MLNEAMIMLDENRSLTGRVKRLRQFFFDTKPSVCVERARLYTQSYKETEGMPSIIRRALALKCVLENISLSIDDDELLVGNLSGTFRGTSVFPEYSVNWLEKELRGDPYYLPTRPGDAFEISDAVKSELLDEIIPYWKGKTHEDQIKSLLPQDTFDIGTKVGTFDANWISTAGDGHIIPDFKKLLNVGLKGIIQEAEEKLASLDFENGDDIDKSLFLKASLIVCKAVVRYAERYSLHAKQLVEKEADGCRRKELERLAQTLLDVPANPASSFYEALQSILIVNCALQMESNGHGVSFGRVDQYLYPLYAKDIHKKKIDNDGILELLSCFWIKINSFHKLKNWASTKFFIGNLVFQNLTIGGQNKYGEDSVNALSYLCLAVTKKLRMVQPSLTVRVFNGTSKIFLHECIKVIRTGIGLPALFNDEAIIPSMLSLHYVYEDAVDYGIVGCVEPSVQGMHCGRYGAAFINWAKILEVTLSGGVDEISGVELQKCKKLGEYGTFDELEDAFKKQMLYTLKQHVRWDNCIDKSFEEMYPDPLLSSLIDCCIARGLPIKKGGAKYDFTGGQSVGVISAANALLALKRVVFDQKLLSQKQVLHALVTNYNDQSTEPAGEIIRGLMKTKSTAFGNDDHDSDAFARKLVEFWSIHKMAYRNTRYGKGPVGGIFIPSTATVSANVSFGENVGATPDGRKAKEPVSEGISAYRGTDNNGPTALINSISAIPNILMPGGQLLNVKISPSSMEGETGLNNTAALIRTLFEKKGFHVQFNVIDKETLLDAQKNPQNYLDLIVRVAGYSAYFVTLDKTVQDDVILRTEHGILNADWNN